MDLKIVAIGDQHFKVDNIEEVNLYIEILTSYLRHSRPDVIILLGDLLDTHERIHTIPLNKACELVEKLRNIAKLYILVGNHDMINNKVFLEEHHWLTGLKGWLDVTVVDKVISEKFGGRKFVFCPYVYAGRFLEALNTLENDTWEDADCIFAHQEFYGCKMGAFLSEDGDKWSLDYPPVVSGHIHSNQMPQANIYYPGSSLPVAFGETTRSIYAMLTFVDGKVGYVLDEMELDLPKKRIIYTSMDEINDKDLDVVLRTDTKDKIKLSVSGDYVDYKIFKDTQKFKDLIDKGVKVIFKQTRRNVLEQKNILNEVREMDGEQLASGEDDGKKVVDFNVLLKAIVKKEDSKYLTEAYELAINGRDVMILE